MFFYLLSEGFTLCYILTAFQAYKDTFVSSNYSQINPVAFYKLQFRILDLRHFQSKITNILQGKNS